MKPPFYISIILMAALAGCATDLSSRRSEYVVGLNAAASNASTPNASPSTDEPAPPKREVAGVVSGAPAVGASAEIGVVADPLGSSNPLQVEPLEPNAQASLAIPMVAQTVGWIDRSNEGARSNEGENSNGEPSVDGDSVFQSRDWTGITRHEIHRRAIEHHPAVAQAQANYNALKGKHQQVGRPPNPTVGIVGSDINEDGGAGRYGVYFGRAVVRGGKRIASQNVVSAELESAAEQLEVVKQRLLTDVDQTYYEVLVAQEQIALSKQLEALSRDAVKISQSLFESQEIPKTSVLQSELELRKSQLATRRFEAAHLSASRKLAAIIGQEKLPTSNVAGNVRAIEAVKDFESAYDQILRDSPELSKLFADIESNKRQLIRDQVEPISNVTWQTSFLYDFVTDDIIGEFQVGWQIPKLDSNRGAIYQSQQRIIAAQRRAETKALDLRKRLAAAYEQYLDAQIQVTAFEDEILPIATETADLLLRGYRAGETEVLELLVAQRALFQTNLAYLQNLRVLWQQTAAIQGMLLTDGLADQER